MNRPRRQVDGWRIALLALAGIVALVILLAPADSDARRRRRSGRTV